MTYFYLIMTGIVMLALFFVFYPIIMQKVSNSVPGEASKIQALSNVSVVKQRMAELEVEVIEGLIDATEKDNAIRDLKLALVDETPTEFKGQRKISPFTIVLLALPALVIGSWVYWQSNQLEGLQTYKASALEVEHLRKKLDEQGAQSLTPDDFAKFALSIRTSLRENPNDARGWSFLAMVSTSIGRVDEGLAAYQKALDITPGDNELRFKYAETLMIQGSEESLQNASRQLDYLIKTSPDNRNNRLLMTSVAIQLQDAELAVSQFVLIKDALNPQSQFYQSIVSELRNLGINDEAIVGIPNGASPLVAQQNPAMQKTTEVTAQGDKQLLINVSVSDTLQPILPKSAYLIVFAQHSDGRSKAPLAVKRFALPSLPIQISLSDIDAMIPAMNLSSATMVNVTARISLDEDVMPSSGELEGVAIGVDIAMLNSTNNTIDVVINEIL